MGGYMTINDIFESSKQFLFIGQMELTQEELNEIKKVIYTQTITKKVSKGLAQAVTLYVIHLSKQYSHDYSFYEYIEQSFDKPDFKFSQIYDYIEEFYKLSIRPLFISQEGKRLFKSSILAQAMSPKDSMFGLFYLLDDILNESLLGYYQKGDPIIHTIAKKLSSKLSKEEFDEDDKGLKIGSKTYGLRASLKHSIVSDVERFERLIECIMCHLSNHSILNTDDYLYKLLIQWQFMKSREVNSVTEKSDKMSKVIPISKWKPEITFIETQPIILMPDLRLEDYEIGDQIEISVRFGSKMYSREIHTFGNEIVMNISGRKLELLLEENPANTNLDLRIVITQNKDEIYEYVNISKDLFVYNNKIVEETILDTLDFVTIYSTFNEEYERLNNVKQLGKYIYFQDLTKKIDNKESDKLSIDELNQKGYEIKVPNLIEDLLFTNAIYKNIKVYNDINMIGLKIPHGSSIENVKLEVDYLNETQLLNFKHHQENKYYSYIKFEPCNPSVFKLKFVELNKDSFDYLDGLVNFPANHPFDNKVLYGRKHFVTFNNQIYTIDPIRYQEDFEFLDGKLSYRFNFLTWSFGNFKAINYPLSEILWFESVNNNRLTIKVKNGPISNFSLRLNDIEIHYTSGVEIDLIPIFDLFISKHGNVKNSTLVLKYQNIEYELVTFAFKKYILKGYYFDYDNENLNIDFSRQYVGPENKKFKIEFENDGNPKPFEIQSRDSISLDSFSEGYYKVKIKIKSESIFMDDSVLLESFNWTYGDPYKFRYENKQLHIDKCSWLENPNRFEVKGVIIRNLKFISNYFFPQYHAELLISDEIHKVKVKIVSKDRIEIERLNVNNASFSKYRYDKKRKTFTNQKEDHRNVFEIEEMFYAEVENV